MLVLLHSQKAITLRLHLLSGNLFVGMENVLKNKVRWDQGHHLASKSKVWEFYYYFMLWNKTWCEIKPLVKCLQLLWPTCKLPNPQLVIICCLNWKGKKKHNFHKYYCLASTKMYSVLIWLLEALLKLNKTVIPTSCFPWIVINLKWIFCHYNE